MRQITLVVDAIVPRQLSFEHDREQTIIAADAVLSDQRLVGRPLILLGEAGSGKSALLKQWNRGIGAITARQLATGRPIGEGRALVEYAGDDPVDGRDPSGETEEIIVTGQRPPTALSLGTPPPPNLSASLLGLIGRFGGIPTTPISALTQLLTATAAGGYGDSCELCN